MSIGTNEQLVLRGRGRPNLVQHGDSAVDGAGILEGEAIRTLSVYFETVILPVLLR